jgi:hypothetical protein
MITQASVEKDAREGFYRLTLTNSDMAGDSRLELICTSDLLRYLRRACDDELRKLAPTKPKSSKKSCAYCGGKKLKFLSTEPCEQCNGTGFEPTYLSEFEAENETD